MSTSDSGTLTGSLDGYVLTGTWIESTIWGEEDTGLFEFTFSEGWESFSGAWGWGLDPETSWSGSWSGTRKDCDD